MFGSWCDSYQGMDGIYNMFGTFVLDAVYDQSHLYEDMYVYN